MRRGSRKQGIGQVEDEARYRVCVWGWRCKKEKKKKVILVLLSHVSLTTYDAACPSVCSVLTNVLSHYCCIWGPFRLCNSPLKHKATTTPPKEILTLLRSELGQNSSRKKKKKKKVRSSLKAMKGNQGMVAYPRFRDPRPMQNTEHPTPPFCWWRDQSGFSTFPAFPLVLDYYDEWMSVV